MVNYRTALKFLLTKVLGKALKAGLIFLVFAFTSQSVALTSASPKTFIREPKVSTLTQTSIESEEASEEVIKLQEYLESRNSPMASNSVDFYKAAKSYDIDPYLLPAISGVESSFGNQLIPGSYNPFGWANGQYYFQNFSDAIYTVARALREKYVPTGEISASRIGPTYASSWPTWIPKVDKLLSSIKSYRSN